MKVLKKISKYLVYLLISIIILFFGIYLFIQTDTFNKWALGYTIEKINDSWVSKDCKVNAESIEGNILKGLKLNNGNVIVKNDTLISFNCLIVNYNLWDLLNKKITIESLTLNSPDINLVSRKVNDSLVWNFSKLISTDETQDTSSEKFGWDIEVQNLKIEAGKVRIAGNYREDIPLWKLNRRISNFNYDSLDINELELDMEAKYLKNSKSFNVRNLSFVTNSDFYLKKFSLNAEVNESDTVTDIHSLELITGRSEMFLKNVKVNSFNPLDSLTYNNFYTKQLNAEISINRFDFADLRYFIPGMEMLDSIVALHLDLNGNYNNLKINDLTLKLPNSIIAFNGMVNNLENPSQLYLDIKTKELSVYPSDINTVYHSSLIPDYSQLGKVEGKILYRGTFSSFYSDFELKTGAGNIDGNATLDLDRESYSGLITTSSLNLSKILNDRSKNSSINCAVKFEGSGFSLAKLNADIIYSVDNSKVMGYGISSSAGNIKASNSNFEMNIKAITSAGNGVIVGKVNIANLKDPVYILKGKVNNLDISKFTNDPEDKSNINTAFDINGRGSGLNNINGKFNFSVENSKYSKYLIPKTPVNIRIQSTGGKGSISAITDIAELHAEGVFDLGTISDAVRYNLSTFSNLVYKTSGQDSLITMVSSVKPVNRNVNLKFEFFIKDSLRFAQISSPFGINFNGGLKGSLTNSSEYFSTGLNINIKNFSYMDTVFVLRDVHSDLLFRNNFDSENNEGFSPYNIVFNTSGSRIVYNGTEIDSSLLKFELADGRAAFSVSAKQDSTIKGMVLGLISLKDKKITLNIDSLNADYGLYNVQNDLKHRNILYVN